MIFIVLVGGLGTVEGPIIGAVLFFLIQNRFADYGPWYLVGLGVIAILIALFVPRGIWGEIETRFDVHLLPVGHTLRTLPAEDGTHHAHSLAMTTQPGDHLDSDG
jgi:branched-chain amino acid transport system permease protein